MKDGEKRKTKYIYKEYISIYYNNNSRTLAAMLCRLVDF